MLTNALTVDVEEYFHPNAMDGAVDPAGWDTLPPRVPGATRQVLDLLDACGVTATFFVLGWVAERWPVLVRDIAARGHEIASHGYAHRLVYKLGPEGFRSDITRGKAVLEDALGQPVTGFRAASWSIVAGTPWALDMLVEAGFTWDSSIFPVRHDIYGIPGFSRFPVHLRCSAGDILEIPPSTVRLGGQNWPVAGGGYFRLLPYAVTRWAIRHINRVDARPAMVYVHPWEFDVDQPRLPAPWTSRMRQYVNLSRTESRLRRLVSDFRFGPISRTLAPLAATAPTLVAPPGGTLLAPVAAS